MSKQVSPAVVVGVIAVVILIIVVLRMMSGGGGAAQPSATESESHIPGKGSGAAPADKMGSTASQRPPFGPNKMGPR